MVKAVVPQMVILMLGEMEPLVLVVEEVEEHRIMFLVLLILVMVVMVDLELL